MNMLWLWIQQPAVAAWGWTLAHFVWQGSLLAVLWSAVQFALRGRSPRIRYRVGCVFLATLVVAPWVTWWLLEQPPEARGTAPAMAAALGKMDPANQVPEGVAGLSAADLLGAGRVEELNGITDTLAPWLAVGWLLGVVGMSARMLVGWRRLARIRREAVPVQEEWLLASLADLRRRMHIRKALTLQRSAAVSVPALVGWRHPVVLLPAVAVEGLSRPQVELLLAHELAHLRRRDPWVNLGQVVLETLWFFHPAVWWISGWVREEREHCCDAAAVAASGDPGAYASALVAMEELRRFAPAFGLGAGGGSLRLRIRRILGLDPAPAGWRRMLGALLLVLGTLTIVAAIVCALVSPARYEAVVRLQVDQPESVILKEFFIPPDRAAQDDYMEVQLANLSSRSLLQAVVRKQRLSEWGSFSAALDVEEQLQRCLDVRRVGLGSWTRLLDVRITLEEPRKAAAIANTLAEEFIDWMAASRNERASSQLFFLRHQASGLEGEVAKAEEDLHHYRMRTKFVTFDPEQNPLAHQLTRLRADYAEAKSRAGAATALVALLDEHVAQGKPLETFPKIGSDPQMQRLRAELARLELEHAQQLKLHAPGEAEAKASQAKLEDLRALITRLAGQAAELLRGEAQVSRALAQEQKRLAEEGEAEMFDWNRARLEYDVLSRKAAAKTALYNQVLARVNELDIGQREQINNIRIVDLATPPVSPVHPLRKLALLLFAAGVVAGVAGLALAPPRGARKAPAEAS